WAILRRQLSEFATARACSLAAMSDQSYRQHLPALDLAIERNTEKVPGDGWYYVLRKGEALGRYRGLKAAKAAWQAELDAEGWVPPQRPDLSAEEKLRRDKLERERADYF